MNNDLLSIESGSAAGTVSVEDKIFAADVNEHLIYEAVKNELANKRQGTASTKERGDVAGSTSKLYRQKGTGRARAGTKKSPIWVGGGVAFGPHPRSYRTSMPKKMRRRAMVSLLSKKMAESRVKIIQDFDIPSGKTKDLATKLAAVTGQDRVLLIVKDGSPMIRRAAKNIPWVRCYSSARLAFKDMFYAKELVISESALREIEKQYAFQAKGE